MRILFVLNKAVNDGPNRVVFSLASNLEKRGWQVRVIFMQNLDQVPTPLALKFNQMIIGPQEHWSKLLPQLAKEFKPTHSIFSLARPIIQALPVAARLGIPNRIAINHGVHELSESRVPYVVARWGFRHGLAKADTLISVSQMAERELLKAGLWNTARGKHHVIWNGVEIATDEMIHPESTSLKLFSVGNLRPIKGYDLLVQAMSLVVDRFPKVCLQIAGDGPEMDRLKSQANRLGLNDHVIFLGHRSDLADFYKSQPIYVQPSKNESFGLAAADALAWGCPVVAFDGTGLAEVSRPVARLCVPGSHQDLAAKIIGLLSDRSQRLALSEESRKFARLRLGIETMQEKYYQLLTLGQLAD